MQANKADAARALKLEIEKRERIANDVRMMGDPGQWPRWPVLPVKERERKQGEFPLCGFIWSGDLAPGSKPRVFLCNMYKLFDEAQPGKLWGEILASYQHESFESFEALALRWEVN